MRLNESIIELSCGKRILFYTSVTNPDDNRIHEHHHTEIELSMCLRGSGTYIINNKEYLIQKSDIIVLASDEPHYFGGISEGEPLKMANLRFEPVLLWSDKELSQLIRFFTDKQVRINKLSGDTSAAKKIGNMFMQIYNEVDQKQICYKLMIKNLLMNMLTVLNRLSPVSPESYGFDSCPQTLVQLEKAIIYINENIEQHITLDMLAKTVSMNKTYFSTIFKKLNGISLWDYITIKRVEKAVELLQTTNLTKIDIALNCGFNSSANFYKAFKRVTGKSPGFFTK